MLRAKRERQDPQAVSQHHGKSHTCFQSSMILGGDKNSPPRRRVAEEKPGETKARVKIKIRESAEEAESAEGHGPAFRKGPQLCCCKIRTSVKVSERLSSQEKRRGSRKIWGETLSSRPPALTIE